MSGKSFTIFRKKWGGADLDKKIRILFTNLMYLNQNYGAQAIGLTMMKKLSQFINAEYVFTVLNKYYEKDISFSKEYGFSVIPVTTEGTLLERSFYLGNILYMLIKLLRNKRIAFIPKEHKDLYLKLLEEVKRSDVVIDLSGIEYVGDISLLGKWASYFSTNYYQRLADKFKKKYLKYTKSYGPFEGWFYRFFIKRTLDKLPFLFVRGEDNLKEVQKLNLKIPVYAFPDISIALEPEKEDWAIRYLADIGVDTKRPIVGLTPSSVIANYREDNNICGFSHIKLCQEIIKFFQQKGRQVLLIPHSIDPVEKRNCDLYLSNRIYEELEDKTDVKIIPEALDYPKMKAIIGLLEFYITSRYHSLSSALSMCVPVVSLSWHIKYKDIMSLFLDDFLAIDSKSTGLEDALYLIKKYYEDQHWFNKDEVKAKKEALVKQIDESISLLVNEINRSV